MVSKEQLDLADRFANANGRFEIVIRLLRMEVNCFYFEPGLSVGSLMCACDQDVMMTLGQSKSLESLF